MAILQALITAIGHSAGKLANLAFAWATTMLFGKVPDDRQVFLSAICLVSVVWLIALIGVVFPHFATWLLSFATVKWLSSGLLRIIMIVLVIVAPLVAGVIALFLKDKQQRPRGKQLLTTILRGYPLTLGLALTLVMLVVIAPCMKVIDLVKCWESRHVPVQIMPEAYDEVTDELERALADAGLQPQRTQSSAFMRFPLKLLLLLSGSTFNTFVADKLTTFRMHNGEVAAYPSDIIVRAPKALSGRLEAVITEHLAFGKASFTWTKDAQHFENLLKDLRNRFFSGRTGFDQAMFQLNGIAKEIESSNLDFREWETIFRDQLMLERDIYKEASGQPRSARSAA